jgi:hypothetical protein
VGAFEEFVKSPECLQARKGRTGPEPRTEEAILGRLTAAR